MSKGIQITIQIGALTSEYDLDALNEIYERACADYRGDKPISAIALFFDRLGLDERDGLDMHVSFAEVPDEHSCADHIDNQGNCHTCGRRADD